MLRNTKKGMPELRNYAFSQRCLIVLSNLGALKALSCSRSSRPKRPWPFFRVQYTNGLETKQPCVDQSYLSQVHTYYKQLAYVLEQKKGFGMEQNDKWIQSRKNEMTN